MLRPAWPFDEWSVPSSRMFVPEEMSREFCFFRADLALAGSRLFASDTPLDTER